MNISEASKQWLNRPSYHGTLGLLTVITVPLYIFELLVLVKRRHKPPFNSFFFLLWKFQAILDLGALLNYFLVGFLRNIPLSWHFFLSTNGTWFPPFTEVTCTVFLFGEMFGVSLISLHRMISLCWPRGTLLSIVEPPTLLVALVYFGVPLLLCIPLIVATPTYYLYSAYNTVVQLETNMHAGIQAAITGPLAIVCTLASTVCYVAIFVKIVAVKRKMNDHIGRRDLRSTRLAFLLFVSLIVNFVYLIVYMIGGYFNNIPILVFISAYNFVPTFMLALTNPWSLLLHKSFRRQLTLMSGRTSIVAGSKFIASDPMTRRTQTAVRQN